MTEGADNAFQLGTTHRAESNAEQQQSNNTTRNSTSSFSKTSWHTVGSSSGETLCRAVTQNDEQTVRQLLQTGANAETPGHDRKKPLLIASERGLIRIMEVLLSTGADVESQTHLTEPSALIRACEEGHEAAVQVLVEGYGANIEARRMDGYTPLFIAIESANESLVKYLLEHGANKSSVLPDGRTVMNCAEGNDSLLALLRKDLLLQGPEIGTEQRLPEPQFERIRPPLGPDDDTTQWSAAQKMQATYIAFVIGRREQRSRPISISVYDLLYGKGPDALAKEYTATARSEPTFTWYHIPANNVSVRVF